MRVAFWNVGDGPDFVKVMCLDRLSRRGSDVIVLSEVSDRSKLLSRWVARNDWYLWHGDRSPGAAAIAFLVYDGDTVIHRATHEATPRTDVGPFGAGPSVVKRKVVAEVDVVDDGGRLDILGTHLVASATRNRPGQRRQLATLLRRRRLYRRHIRALARLVRETAGEGRALLVVGDFNANPGARLLRPLRRLGLRQHIKRDTFGNDTYDQAYTLNADVSRVVVVPMPGHDHDAILVDVEPVAAK